MLSQLHTFTRFALSEYGRYGRSLVEYMSMVGTPSSSAVLISNSCPVAEGVYLLISYAITPLYPRSAFRLPVSLPGLFDRHVHELERRVVVLCLTYQKIARANIFDRECYKNPFHKLLIKIRG